MNIFAALSLLSFVVVFFVGQYVYFEDPKSNINRTFAIYCALVAYWCFTEFMYRNAPNFSTASLWVGLQVIAGAFLGPGFLHFSLVFTEKKNLLQNKLTYIIIYVPAIITAYIFSLTNLGIGKAVFRSYGWFYTYGPYYLPTAGWDMFLGTIGLLFTLQTSLTTKDPKKKNQALIIFYGFLGPITLAIITGIVFPIINISAPLLLSTGFAIMIVIIAYAITKYELFAVNPATAADNIVSTMADALIIMEPNGEILSVNKATSDLLGYNEKELIKKPANDLFADKNFITNLSAKKWEIRGMETKFLTKQGKMVPVLFSSSTVLDKKGEIAGIIGVANNITERYIANTLQEALLQVPRVIKGIDYGTLYRSATEAAKVGGDFYDLFELNGNKVGIVVGDISGKGIEAATLTSLIKNTIRAYAYLEEPPGSIMGRTNNIVKKVSTPRTFVTVFFGILNIANGEMTYVSAGHPMAFIKKRAYNIVEPLVTSSTVIGVFAGQTYINDYKHIDNGDSLVLYTDGATEARCKDGFFGEERLADFIKKSDLPVNKLPQAIFDNITSCTEDRLSDDIVLMALSRK